MILLDKSRELCYNSLDTELVFFIPTPWNIKKRKGDNMSRAFKVSYGILIVLLIASICSPMIGDAMKKKKNEQIAKEQVAYVTNLIDKMRSGDLLLAEEVVSYCHTITSMTTNTPPIKIDMTKDIDVALAILEAEARYYAKRVNGLRTSRGMSALMPDIKRAWFYAELTGGLEKYSLTMNRLEVLWKLGAKELEEQSDPENGGYAMVPIRLDKNIYQIETPLGPIIPPGGIEGMAQEVFNMAKKMSKK